MTVEQADVVDFVGVETASGKVILSIVDHLDWSDIEIHLLTLQEKLNRYIGFFESGEILEAYPDSKGRPVVIALLLLFPLSADERARTFISRAQDALNAIGLELRVSMLPWEEAS